MKKWFVVHTQAQKEQVAKIQLQQQQFEVLLPEFKTLRRHARKTEEVIKPLFPRYLFVSFDPQNDRWYKINSTRGVSYLLTNLNQPIPIPQQTVSDFLAKQDDQGLVAIDSLTLLFKPGDKITVNSGALQGQTAIFQNFKDAQRVSILLDFLGRQKSIEVPTHSIDKI